MRRSFQEGLPTLNIAGELARHHSGLILRKGDFSEDFSVCKLPQQEDDEDMEITVVQSAFSARARVF